MRYLRLDEMKPRTLALLKEFKELCEEHGLKYFISAGTLLGAVKYKGYIPWDDDIDVTMLEEDYNKLIELARQGKLKNPFHCHQLDSSYKLPFGKYAETTTLCTRKLKRTGKFGLHVDIFPLYGRGTTKEQAQKLQKRSRFLARMNYWLCVPMWLKWIWLIPPLTPIFFMPKFFINRQFKIAKKHPIETSTYVGSTNMKAHIQPKELFEETTMLPFEDDEFAAPKRYMEFLANRYGKNFMDPYPEHLQTNHNYKILVLEED